MLKKIIAGVLVLLTVALAVFSQLPYGVGWNFTPSIPTGLYLTKTIAEDESLKYGDIVCFRFVEPDWAAGRKYVPPGMSVCKPVVGLPGDALIVTGGTLTVREDGPAVQVALRDSKGRPLVPAITQTGLVPDGHVFLLATYLKNSLDSRYLGSLPRNRIVKKIEPLWVLN